MFIKVEELKLTQNRMSMHNPPWTRDELVLVCKLLEKNRWREMGVNSLEVEILSKLLRALTIYPAQECGPNFRNPHSVRRKMSDIATHHPESERKATNGGRLDIEVLHNFLDRSEEMQAFLDILESPTSSRSAKKEKKRAVGPLSEALRCWARLENENSEEYWQKLFSSVPLCFAFLLQGKVYELEGKRYVGGKRRDNQGGNILDFLAITRGNVACVEIKAPGAALMAHGAPYRNNVHLPSSELTGAVMQVLESRRQLLVNLATLNQNAGSEGVINAPHPTCYVIIGNLEKENLNESQFTSFELYRGSLRDVTIATYDEIFNSLKSVVRLMTDNID